MGVGDDVQGPAVGLLARWLDLIHGELEAKLSFVPQLKGVGEGDPLCPSPVSGGTGVGVCREKKGSAVLPFHRKPRGKERARTGTDLHNTSGEVPTV